MGLGMWDQLEMSCTFSALQLRRLDSRMLWYATGLNTQLRRLFRCRRGGRGRLVQFTLMIRPKKAKYEASSKPWHREG